MGAVDNLIPSDFFPGDVLLVSRMACIARIDYDLRAGKCQAIWDRLVCQIHTLHVVGYSGLVCLALCV